MVEMVRGTEGMLAGERGAGGGGLREVEREAAWSGRRRGAWDGGGWIVVFGGWQAGTADIGLLSYQKKNKRFSKRIKINLLWGRYLQPEGCIAMDGGRFTRSWL